MESYDAGDGQDDDDGEPPPRHYSTGRLTRAQADLVNAWRARLAADRPLPGRDRVGEAARLLGLDDRPPASCSDIIAAAVMELLGREPDELRVAQYAYAGWQAQQAAGGGRRDDARAPVYPPVSFYLPGYLAGPYDDLRERARERVRKMRRELETEAARRFEDEKERAAWLMGEMVAQGIPLRMGKVSGGVLARMAIDGWARRSADRVCSDAVAYAAGAHQQPHRGRRDMHKLSR